MLTAVGSAASGNLRRLLWSLLASAVLNVAFWVFAPSMLSRTSLPQPPREIVKVSVSRLHIGPEPRATMHPSPKHAPLVAMLVQPKRTARAIARRAPSNETTTELAPPPPAYIALPSGWNRQGFAFLGTTETAEWLNWSKTKHSEKWVPRVFLWRMKMESGYMQGLSLHDAVQHILATLHQDAKITVSKAQRVCDGEREGWFLSYVKPDDDPPLHFDETVLLADGKVYRAMYIRSVNQPEDADTRDALKSLCRF